MGGTRLEGEFLAEAPCYRLPSFKAPLKCHLLLKAFLDSSLAPWIKRRSWGAWLHPPANRPGLAGSSGSRAGCPSLALTVAECQKQPGCGVHCQGWPSGPLGTPWAGSCCPEPEEHWLFQCLPAPNSYRPHPWMLACPPVSSLRESRPRQVAGRTDVWAAPTSNLQVTRGSEVGGWASWGLQESISQLSLWILACPPQPDCWSLLPLVWKMSCPLLRPGVCNPRASPERLRGPSAGAPPCARASGHL